MIFTSEKWFSVKDEFDELGRMNFDECGIAEGKREYSLDHKTFEVLDDLGMVHVTTARKDKLVGYVLSILQPRHLQFQAYTSQMIGIYLLPRYRTSFNGLRLMEKDEGFLKKLGIEKMYGGFTLKKDLSPLFKRRGWKEAETMYGKWING